MMNMTEFIEKLKEEIREYLPEDVRGDIIIDDVEVVKMNDQKLHGLTFKTPDSDAAPTLYVDEMFSAYMDGSQICIWEEPKAYESNQWICTAI